ncbi:MAG: hypothetical protein ACK53Y_13350, partial [bacterium]
DLHPIEAKGISSGCHYNSFLSIQGAQSHRLQVEFLGIAKCPWSLLSNLKSVYLYTLNNH